MENNKSDLTNPLSVEEARAEDSLGLSSVLEEFENGVDIQPLNDIVKEEIIPFESNFELEEQLKSPEERATEKKQRVKRGFIKAAVAVLVVCLLVFAGYNVFLKVNDFAHYAVAVYQRGDNAEVLLDNDKVFTIENVVEAKLSKSGDYLVYSQPSTTKTGKLDLRVVEVKKRSSVGNKGTLAASGVEDDWLAGRDCAYVYYNVTEEDGKTCYAYITDGKKTEPVSAAAEEVFLPPNGDIVYFTRKTAQGTQLFKMRVGEKAVAVSYVDGIKAFSDENTLEIFYTVANDTDENTYSLYKITGDEEPQTIATDVSEVYLDYYQIGGNLYYFVKSDSGFDWGDFVVDAYADADASLTKPVKDDYSYTVGFIFKRKKIDENAYDQAMEVYKEKEKRDDIRQSLNNSDLGVALSSEYKMKVFDGEKSRELSGNVKLENLAAFSKSGMPKIIVRKSGVTINSSVDMDTLYEIAGRNGVDRAVDYAIQTLRSSGYETNFGYKYIFSNGSNVYEYDFNPSYDTENTVFYFGGKNSIFAAVRTDLLHSDIYYCKAENDSITTEKLILRSVTAIELSGDKLYASVEAGHIKNDLYICFADGSCKLACESVEKYFLNGDSIIALKAIEDEASVRDVELVTYKNGQTTEIDGGVYNEEILVKNGRVAYIKNYKESEYEGDLYGGDLIIYDKNGHRNINTSVSKVFAIY